MNIDIWIIHQEKKILVTDLGGVPAVLTGYVSGEAQAAAEARGWPSVSELGFPADSHLIADDWPEALRLAGEKAGELGYEVKQEDSFYYLLLNEDEDDDDWFGPNYVDDYYDPYEGEYEDEPSPDLDPDDFDLEFYGADVEDLLEFEADQGDH